MRDDLLYCLGSAARAMKKETHPNLSLAFFTGLNLFNYLDRYVLSAVLTPLKAELGLSDGQLGRVFTAFMVGYFFTSPLFGYLGDRSPRKWLIAFGIFFWSLGTMLSGFATTLTALLLFRVLVGLGEASYATLAPAWISDLFPSNWRNNALTIFYVAIPVGSALGYVVGGLALGHGGWRNAFLWAGAPGLLLALGLLALREPERGEAEAPANGVAPAAAKPKLREILGLFRLADFNLVLLGYTAYTFALGAFAFWGPTFLHRVHGMGVAAADHFFGLVLVGAGLVATLLGGFAATAWQRRFRAGYASLLAGSILLAVPVAAAAFLFASTAMSMTCLGIAMFLLFLPTGPINTLIVESVPVALRASAMAASIFVIHLFGDFWSPEAIGRLADSSGGLQRAVLVLPAVLALGGFFWLALAVRKAREPAL